MNDIINHPSHYTDGNIEVIDYIEDKGFGYHLGNAIKYISRAGKKDPDKEIEDLQKAMWYIARYIKLRTEHRENDDIPMWKGEEIVRCKDCRYCYYADNRVEDEQGYVCDMYYREADPNGFCHLGRRREDGEA